MTTGLFLVVLVVYLASLNPIVSDGKYQLHVTESLLSEGNINLDEYSATIPPNDYRVMRVDGHLYSVFPVGPAVMALPFYVLAKAGLRVALEIPGVKKSIEAYVARTNSTHVSKITALSVAPLIGMAIGGIYTALAAALIFLIARRYLRVRHALIVAAVFAFGTAAWSTTSRSLWQHGPSLFLFAAALLLLDGIRRRVRQGVNERWGPPLLLGAVAAMAYVVRPTNSVLLFAFTIYLLVIFVRARALIPILRYATGVGTVAIPFVLYNQTIFGLTLPPYYSGNRLFTNATFFEAAAANLISPARGLIVFSPVLVFSGWGAWRKWRDGVWTGLDWTLAGIFVAHSIVIASFGQWWAGYSYGPRYYSDMLVVCSWFLVPAVEALRSRTLRLKAVFVGLAAISVFINGYGGLAAAPQQWNVNPRPIDNATQRIWDWQDPPFLRGIVG